MARRKKSSPRAKRPVLDELGKKAAGKNMQFEDYVDMRALTEIEKEWVFDNRYGKSACTNASGASPSGPVPSLFSSGSGKFSAAARRAGMIM